MNVLLIDLDPRLADNSQTNDAQKRVKEQARFLSNYFIITRNNGNLKVSKITLSDNLFIFPIFSASKIGFIYEAFCIGRRICRDNRIDCISSRDPYIPGLVGYLLKKRYGIPLNVQMTSDIIDNHYFIKERYINIFLNKLAKWLIKKADTIRISTSKEKKLLLRLGIDERKIWKIPFFVDFNPFLRADGSEIRRRYLRRQFDKIVLSVGRIAKEKDLGTLIQAIPFVIKEYPRVLFLIIGEGPEERRIRNLVLNLGVKNNVCFLGNISYDKIPDFFSACDLFVITSVYEGLPMVLLEAAVSEKPIVSTSYTGAYDVIKEGKIGFILNFKDSMNIAKKIVYLLKNPEIAKEMGERGRKFALEHFDKDRILKDYLNMFIEAVNLSKNENFNYNAEDR